MCFSILRDVVGCSPVKADVEPLCVSDAAFPDGEIHKKWTKPEVKIDSGDQTSAATMMTEAFVNTTYGGMNSAETLSDNLSTSRKALIASLIVHPGGEDSVGVEKQIRGDVSKAKRVRLLFS